MSEQAQREKRERYEDRDLKTKQNKKAQRRTEREKERGRVQEKRYY